jgi:hypothetical protein
MYLSVSVHSVSVHSSMAHQEYEADSFYPYTDPPLAHHGQPDWPASLTSVRGDITISSGTSIEENVYTNLLAAADEANRQCGWLSTEGLAAPSLSEKKNKNPPEWKLRQMKEHEVHCRDSRFGKAPAQILSFVEFWRSTREGGGDKTLYENGGIDFTLASAMRQPARSRAQAAEIKRVLEAIISRDPDLDAFLLNSLPTPFTSIP